MSLRPERVIGMEAVARAIAHEPMPERPEIRNARATVDQMAQVLDANERMKIEIAGYRESLAAANAEVEALRKECRRLRDSRDHFSAAFTSAEADLESIGQMVLKAVRAARGHSTGERISTEPAPLRYARPAKPTSTADRTDEAAGEDVPIPEFLRRQK